MRAADRHLVARVSLAYFAIMPNSIILKAGNLLNVVRKQTAPLLMATLIFATPTFAKAGKELLKGKAADDFIAKYFPNAEIPGQVQGPFKDKVRHGYARCEVPAMGSRSEGAVSTCRVTWWRPRGDELGKGGIDVTRHKTDQAAFLDGPHRLGLREAMATIINNGGLRN